MNNTLETIYSLRSIHNDFSDRSISDADLRQILDASVRAATGSARQSYSIIVTQDRQKIHDMFGCSASTALLYCVDFNRIEQAAKHLNRTHANKGIQAFLPGFTDAVLAAQTAAVAAKSMGIDSLFTNSVHRVDFDKLYEAFNLPKHMCFPVIALILGYPNKEPGFFKGRLTGKGIFHFEQYQCPTDNDLDEIIAAYDDKEKHMGYIDNWESMGFDHYLEWFYDKWNNADRLVPKQKEIFSLLKTAGFISDDVIG